jgi:hypothetical protein
MSIKITIPVDNVLFNNLIEKSDYFLDLAFEAVKKYAQKQIEQYNSQGIIHRFFNGFKFVEVRKYRGRCFDCLNGCWPYAYALLQGDYYSVDSLYCTQTYKTISFCRENGIETIEMDEKDLDRLVTIEKEYNKK